MQDLLTTRQLQELLRVDRITIYRMLSDGRLRGFKVGGQWRFSRPEIEQWLLEQRASVATSEDTAPEDVPSASSAQTLPLSCIQAMQAVFAEALDIAAVTIDLDGALLTDISNSCDFCSLILSTAEGRRRCAASWQPAGTGQVHPCHAGLLCVGAPVEVREQWVASVACCQFVTEPPEGSGQSWRANISALAEQLDLAESNLQAAADSVRTLSERELPRIVRLLWLVADTFGEIGQERARFVERLHRISEMTQL